MQKKLRRGVQVIIRRAKRGSAAKKKEKMARIVGANYTDEASRKHTCTLITVDSDEIGGVSVQRSERE